MKTYHGLLIILLFEIVHRASADFGSFFSGKFNLNGIVGSKPTDEEDSGFIRNAWSNVVAGAKKVATGVTDFSGKLSSHGIFGSKPNNDEEESGFIAKTWSSVATGVKHVAKEAPGFIQDTLSTSTNKIKDLYRQFEEVPYEEKIGFFEDKWYYARDKVKNFYGRTFMSNPPGVFTTDDDNQSFKEYIKSLWSSCTGWLSPSPPGEECTDTWVLGDTFSMEEDMQNMLYGQHLITNHIPAMIRHHWNKQPNPSKALVLSLHGSTGVGKNYVAKIIVDNLFKLADKSKFVTLYSGRLEFSEERKMTEYQERLKSDLLKKVATCDRHVFIFDEVDKIPMGVMDVLKPFIDHNMKIRGHDFRKTIFIFISNMGQNEITSHYMKLWQEGALRREITYSQFEKVLRNAVYNDKGGLRYSENIKFHLIDFYVPFLPLEEEHVRQCIRFAFENNHYLTPTKEEIEAVHEYVDYGPSENAIFSKTGCKAISSKVALIASLRKRNKRYSNKEL